jgi:hypothetical protein
MCLFTVRLAVGLRYICFMGQYSMGDAIEKFLQNSRIKGDIQAFQIEAIWEQLMGKTISKYTDSIKIVNRTLFITTNVAPLKHELNFQKEAIRLRVNEALKSSEIKEVVIQ